MNTSVGARERCQLRLLALRHQIRTEEPGLHHAEAVLATTTAVVTEVESVIGEGADVMLLGRLSRLRMARDAAADAAWLGSRAELQRAVHRFEVLTAAIWVVLDGLRPAANRDV